MKRQTLAILAAVAVFAVTHYANAYAYCQYQKDGSKCHSLAVTGGKYCKKHFSSVQAEDKIEDKAGKIREKERVFAMKSAMNYWRRHRRGKKWVVRFNGYNFTISANGQIAISEEQPSEHIFYDGSRYTHYQSAPEYVVHGITQRERKDNNRAKAAEYEFELEEYKRDHPEDPNGIYFIPGKKIEE